MGNEEVDLISVSKPEKKTLLERYNIPIDNLSYEFISDCTNVKTLERIILILRSGEEGIYPDLTRHAEERLTAIKPTSAILRKAMPVLRPNMLNLAERQEINSEINSWTSEMRSREKDLNEGKVTLISESYPQPEIRKTNLHVIKENKEETRISDKPRGKSKRISSCDYAAWDKYDADTEVNRIDLQVEQEQSKMKKIQGQRKELIKANSVTPETIINKLSLTGTELNVTAEEERKKGNESYRTADYQEALQHYNISITINSNPLAYNNRAMTLIKLQRYEDALRDCNTVLGIDCNNIKALLRRALCLEHHEKFQQALADYEAVLRLEPINKMAISGIQKLRKPRKLESIRMKIQEVDLNDSEDKIEQIRSENTIEANDIKYSKQSINNNICYCDRAPSSSRNITAKPHIKANYCVETKTGENTTNIVTDKSNEKIINIFPAYDKSSITVKDFSNVNETSKSQDIPKEDFISTIHCESLKTHTEYALKKSIFSYTTLPHKRKSSSVIIEELSNTEIYEEPNKVINSMEPKLTIKEQTNLKLIENTTKVYEDKNKESINPEKKDKIQPNVMSENVHTKLENIESPYEFLRMWQSLKNDTDLKSHARLLRSIAHEDINKSNKLDGTMFSLILRCLEQQFCTEKDTVLLTDILFSLSQLSRFSIIYMFMDSKDKKALKNILYFLQEQKSPTVTKLRQIYVI